MRDSKGLHDGHRDRVREKFISKGLSSFRDHEVLELLLFYAVPRKDTNEIAHRLINQFGSISGVMDAPLDVLTGLGLSRNAAVYLKLFPEICSLYYQDKYNSKDDRIITEDNIGDYVLHFFIGADSEKVALILLNSQGKRLYGSIISEGSVSSSDVDIRKIATLAMKYHASGAIIAHNHPSGVAIPSNEDIQVTIALKRALKTVGVNLLDHIIVAEMDYLSMAGTEEFENVFF